MTDLVSKLSDEQRILAEVSLRAVCPDDGKYGKATGDLSGYLSAEAEWRSCVLIQRFLLETRAEFGKADPKYADEVAAAVPKISPLNISLLEEQVTRHDQLAVIEELGRFVSLEAKALLHPGTTSYDVLDTARSFLLRGAWFDVVRPRIKQVVGKLCSLAEEHMDVLQVGRTHLQDTSPVPFGATLAGYAARLAARIVNCDSTFKGLLGKISGIVGTGAPVGIVVGDALKFQARVLEKLGLKPDFTATQIVQKEPLADVGNSVVTLMYVLANFAEDMRLLYSSAIGEVTSLDAQARLKGSSADAGKNNPINWENIAGKAAVVESGMRVLYEMMRTNFQRDLRNSVQARYQPGMMIAETYESFCRASKALDQLFVRRDVVERNLRPVRDMPTEAMTAITRAHGYVGESVGHDVVAGFAKTAKKNGSRLIEIALEDAHFKQFYDTELSDKERCILNGELELYVGSSKDVARRNIEYARSI
ncbi:MAG TPA: lyase family protein [Candidatus Nanoarchaeia archaeon]|nr:lyase family protein [Candidatus Nanoarchaeia archaeon]